MTTPARLRRWAAGAAFVAAVAILASAPAAIASTVYAPGGLGEPSLEEGARIRALGGAGVAEFGQTEFSLVNPASIAELRHLILSGTSASTYRKVTPSAGPSEGTTETTVPSLRAAIRMPLGIVVGGAYVVGTEARFHADRAESAGTASRLRVDGTGGLQFIRLTLAKALTKGVRIGVDHELVAGTYREEWERTFGDTLLSLSRDTVEVRYQRLGRWRLGGQATFGGWTFGGVYETARRLPLNVVEHAAGTSTTTGGRSLTIPDGWTLGASGSPMPKWHVAAQVRRENWKRSSLPSDLVDFRAMTRYSFGVERLGNSDDSAPWQRKLPIRLGVSYLEWPDLLPLAGQTTIAGGTAGVNEITFSVGTGLLTQDKGGAVDFAIEAGKRGDRDKLGADEKYVRAVVSLQIGDDSWK
jgi:hypothetical protein